MEIQRLNEEAQRAAETAEMEKLTQGHPGFHYQKRAGKNFKKRLITWLFFYGISSQVFGVFFQNFDPISEIFFKSDIKDSVGFREMEVILVWKRVFSFHFVT